MTIISDVYAREVLDSRGNPTVEVEVYLESGAIGRAIVPSGASTGRMKLLSFVTATNLVTLVKVFLKLLKTLNELSLQKLLVWTLWINLVSTKLMIALDGTPNKGKLGANAILAVSMAVARAAADALDVPCTYTLADSTLKHFQFQ